MDNVIFKSAFGSHLYGTNSETSDQDFKVVVMPTWEQVALGRIPKGKNETTGDNDTKNSADDIDVEYFSIHQFVKLALEGQTVAMDMIHIPKSFATLWTPIWDDLVSNREKFYSKNIESFIGYAMGQASKYGIKGSRLNDAKSVLDWIDQEINREASETNCAGYRRIIDCNLSTFPKGEHILSIKSYPRDSEDAVLGTDMIEVCNRKILLNSKLMYAKDMVQKFYDNYGERARKAANDEGVDWKAISHAFRAAYQIKELFTKGTITFPRPEADFLKEIKYGKRKYNDIITTLEDLIDEVKELRVKSELPEKPDRKFWDEWLMKVVEDNIVPVGKIAVRKFKAVRGEI